MKKKEIETIDFYIKNNDLSLLKEKKYYIMSIEVYFTPKGADSEIPFTLTTGETINNVFLYSNYLEKEFKYELENTDGILSLKEKMNPFTEDVKLVEEKLVELSSDWIELSAQGFENDYNLKNFKKPGYGPDDIFVENKPFSLRQIVELINNKDIEITPDFQRNFIWDKTRQSKLIESILLGLPLPSIYLSQYEDGRLTIVDGLQRITTIKKFYEDDLILTNLEYLKECNGKKYSQLDGILSPLRIRKFGQTQIMCFVIDYRSPSKLKYDLFRRLNTGGKPLNNQEIRNCLSHHSVQLVLKELINIESFKNATNDSISDNRMEAREAALRFVCFYSKLTDDSPISKYNGDMESTLDDFIDELNKWDINNLRNYISIYDNSLKNAYHLFGDRCFRKVLIETYEGKKAPINKLLMLVISLLLTKYDHNYIKSKLEFNSLIKPLAIYISNSPELFQAISWGTNGKWNIETGYRYFNDFFKLHLSNE